MSGHFTLIRRALSVYDCLKFKQKGVVIARQFSLSCCWHKEEPNTTAATELRKPDTNRGHSPSRRLQSVRGQITPRALDARSLGASGLGSDSKILRAPAHLRSKPVQRLGGRRTSNTTDTATSKARKTGDKKKRNRISKLSNDDREDATIEAEIEEVLYKQEKKERPQPVRYDPVEYDFSNLKETWPSLPIGTNGRASSVYEKLTLMSDRYANAYNAPHELGKKYYRGGGVFFRNKEEKEQALEEARRLAQKRADWLAQRKGTTVEPKDVSFKAITDDNQKDLVSQFVAGKYASLDSKRDHGPRMINEVIRNLANNETYGVAGKQALFLGKLESLLAPPQRVKRG